MLKNEQRSVCFDAVNKWGHDAQVDMVTEECAELILAIAKYKRNPTDETWVEVQRGAADVAIMVEQVDVMSQDNMVKDTIACKIERLKGRIETNTFDADRPGEGKR